VDLGSRRWGCSRATSPAWLTLRLDRISPAAGQTLAGAFHLVTLTFAEAVTVAMSNRSRDRPDGGELAVGRRPSLGPVLNPRWHHRLSTPERTRPERATPARACSGQLLPLPSAADSPRWGAHRRAWVILGGSLLLPLAAPGLAVPGGQASRGSGTCSIPGIQRANKPPWPERTGPWPGTSASSTHHQRTLLPVFFGRQSRGNRRSAV